MSPEELQRLQAMAKPNVATAMNEMVDPRLLPVMAPANPTGEARIGPPSQKGLAAETMRHASGLLGTTEPIGALASGAIGMAERFGPEIQKAFRKALLQKYLSNMKNNPVPV